MFHLPIVRALQDTHKSLHYGNVVHQIFPVFSALFIYKNFSFSPEDIEGHDISVTGQNLTRITVDGQISVENRPNVEAQLMRRDDQAQEDQLNQEIIRRLHVWFAANSWMAQAYFHAREVYEHAKNEAEAQGKQVPQVNFVLLGQKDAKRAQEKIKAKEDHHLFPHIFRPDVHSHRVQLPAQRFENEFNDLYGHVAQVGFFKRYTSFAFIYI